MSSKQLCSEDSLLMSGASNKPVIYQLPPAFKSSTCYFKAMDCFIHTQGCFDRGLKLSFDGGNGSRLNKHN